MIVWWNDETCQGNLLHTRKTAEVDDHAERLYSLKRRVQALPFTTDREMAHFVLNRCPAPGWGTTDQNPNPPTTFPWKSDPFLM